MIKTKKRRKSVILVLLAVLLLISSLIALLPITAAKAETYESIEQDFADTDFDFDNYSSFSSGNKWSLTLIQLAEGVDGSVYVYIKETQPLAKFIRLSRGIEEKLLPVDLSLIFIGRTKSVSKYKIDGFFVVTDAERYYYIVSLYRDFNSDYGDKKLTGQSASTTAYSVGKLYTVRSIDGGLSYSCKDYDTIEIINPFVDYLAYQEKLDFVGAIFNVTKYTDIHYIVFSTNKKIDNLMEADVTYTTQSYSYNTRHFDEATYGEKSKPQYITLTSDKDFTGVNYTWDSILRTEDFIQKAELNSSTKEIVEKEDFVLVFLSTPYTQTGHSSLMEGHSYDISGTKVSDVSILRLEFETNGIVYNLGAVMGHYESDDEPGNKIETPDDFFAWFKSFINKVSSWFSKYWYWLVIGVVAILAIIILSPFLPLIFTAIGKLFVLLFKGLWWLISAPVRLIMALFKKE